MELESNQSEVGHVMVGSGRAKKGSVIFRLAEPWHPLFSPTRSLCLSFGALELLLANKSNTKLMLAMLHSKFPLFLKNSLSSIL
jgi:hypothetical protein